MADASRRAFQAAQNPANIFIKNKHLSSFNRRYAKFATDNAAQAQAWVAEGLRSPNALFMRNSGPGSFRVIANLQRPIGTKGETMMRILVTDQGRVYNAFPIKGLERHAAQIH